MKAYVQLSWIKRKKSARLELTGVVCLKCTQTTANPSWLDGLSRVHCPRHSSLTEFCIKIYPEQSVECMWKGEAESKIKNLAEQTIIFAYCVVFFAGILLRRRHAHNKQKRRHRYRSKYSRLCFFFHPSKALKAPFNIKSPAYNTHNKFPLILRLDCSTRQPLPIFFLHFTDNKSLYTNFEVAQTFIKENALSFRFTSTDGII